MADFSDLSKINDLFKLFDSPEKIAQTPGPPWYIIDLDSIGMEEELIRETHKWCTENLQGAWRAENLYFLFTLEEDCVAFKLRWK